MHLKDYYTILELSPSASLDDVKKAYRRLAQLYHPDKSGDDPYAHAQFTEIKEAYETLTNPSKKDLYLQQRWYAQSAGRRRTGTVVTPASILKQLLELNRYVSRLDIHRMDKEGLFQYISEILADSSIHKLNMFREEDVNREIFNSALQTAQLLPWEHASQLIARLRKIDSVNATSEEEILEFSRRKRASEKWEKQKIWVAILVVILLSLAIFWAAKTP
jgi:molecular chaperone DnaJ